MANNEPLPSLSILHYPRALNERNIQCPLPPRLHLIFVPLQRTLIILAETNLSGLSDRNLSSSYSNYYFLLHAPPSFPPERQDPWTDLERFIHGFSITGRDRTSLIREGNRIEAIRKGAGPRGMHAVVVSDKGVRSVRCTPVGGRECPVRDPPPPSPSAERQYPSCDTPSYDPGFRVSRAAPGGERPRLTQTQNRSPFVALLATSPPRNPLSLPLRPLSLALPQGGSSHS